MKNTITNYAPIRAFIVIALFMGLLFPFSLYAQSYPPQFGRDINTGRLYLLPSHPWGDDFGSRSGVASSGFTVSCAPSANSGSIGQSITWFSSVSGGSGAYLYSWSGTEGLSGNSNAVSKTYTTRGEKSAILTVTSGTRQVTVACGSMLVGGSATNSFTYQTGGFGASCYATPERAVPGESVTWVSIVSGAAASTTYSWDGADGLTGDRPIVSKTYTANGSKFAMLTVTSGSNRIVASCTNFVAVVYDYSIGPKAPPTPQKPVAPSSLSERPAVLEIQGLCAPSSAKTAQNTLMEWRAVAIGGTGAYRFSWFGDDALLGDGATTSKQYETAGIKRASVLIASGDKTKTVACYPIEITKAENGLFAGAFFSWLDGKVGFAIAAILVIIFGVFMALRRRSKEDTEEDERDHVQ